MTREEFERGYAERSGVSLEWLHRYRRALPCPCESIGCDGWQMISKESAQSEYELGRITADEFAEAWGEMPIGVREDA